MLYRIPLETSDKLQLSAPVAVAAALGVFSFIFSVASGSERDVFAVGVPETVICVKLSRETEMPFTASQE